MPRPMWVRMEFAAAAKQRKEKLVVIMGATGTGKSRLSIDLAGHFPVEVVNSDKMQVYQGLDITTNKIPVQDRLGVPHHLLGEVDPELRAELTRSEFRLLAGRAVSDITARNKVPVLVGGSNSFVHALLVDRFDPESDVFDDRPARPGHCRELRYSCCFLWVHVSSKVLRGYLDKRVDEMLDSGMFDELAEFYDPDEDHGPENRAGLRKAIGVPEFDRFFERFRAGGDVATERSGWDRVRRSVYEETVGTIKENTWQLAKKQLGKITRLKNSMGWDVRRLDATEAFRAAMMMTSDSGERRRFRNAWERQVLEPSVKIVKRFLKE